MIECPYCKIKFPADYYHLYHVPCPEPAGDVRRKKK